MARVQLFLSTVSAEFLSYRERLRHLLTRPDVEVKVQEDFIVTGDETLEMLDAYIQGCDGVIHLVGDMTGSMAMAPSVAAIAQEYPELASRFPLGEFLQPGGPSLSYTQWEAWLALLHHKPLFIATPQEGAPRDEKYTREPGQQALQQSHLSRLKEVARYPGTAFTSQEHLAAEVLRSFVLDLLVQAGLSPIRPTPHNLPERTTSAERFVGRSQELEQLKSLLAPEGSRAYLTGMGGVGKSELSIQHAYDSFDLYRGGIVRLDARQGLDAMALQVVTFFRGRFPDVALPEDRSPTELLPVCWSQWPANANPPEPVLLILDDQRGDNEGYAAERQLLEGLPPRFRRLITQRETAPTTAQAIDLPLLKREASLELLALQAGQGGTERLQAEEQAADALCDAVGDLPLALVLLGARLSERPDLQLSQLLADLQAKGPEAKALRQAHPELGAKLGVVEALLISWEPLNEPAKSLALLLSVMAPAVIPWELVEACRLPEQEVEEGSAFGDAQAELLRSKFLERSGAGLYRLHPLVRQFLRLQSQGQPELVGRCRRQFLSALLIFSNMIFPDSYSRASFKLYNMEAPSEYWKVTIEYCIPHLHSALRDYYEYLDLESLFDLAGWFFLLQDVASAARLLSKTGVTRSHFSMQLNSRNKSQRKDPRFRIKAGINFWKSVEDAEKTFPKETWWQRSGQKIIRTFGDDHPVLAVHLLKWAQLESPAQSLPIQAFIEQSLSIVFVRYGADHPNTQTVRGNYTALLQAMGLTELEIQAKIDALQPPT